MLSHAPAVRVNFTRSSTYGAVLLVIGYFNVSVLVMLGLHEADALYLALLALLFCCIFSLAVRAWRRTPIGTLEWDGNAWRWSAWPQDETCQVQWTIALPGLSVLRLTTGAGDVQWLLTGPAMERPAQWAAFRRALVAHVERGHDLAPEYLRV
jgi:hypothetical protein